MTCISFGPGLGAHQHFFEDLPGRNLCMKWDSRNVSAKPQKTRNVATQTLNSWVHSLSWSLHTWPLKDLTEQNWSLVPTLGRRYPHSGGSMSADISPISTEPEATLAFQRNWPPDSELQNWSCGNPAAARRVTSLCSELCGIENVQCPTSTPGQWGSTWEARNDETMEQTESYSIV